MIIYVDMFIFINSLSPEVKKNIFILLRCVYTAKINELIFF